MNLPTIGAYGQAAAKYRSRVGASDPVTTPETTKEAAYVTSPGRSRNMSAIRRTNTKPEVALRSALHRAGLRFRKDYAIRIHGKLIRPDVVFTKRKVAVFVDGCFWHSCPEHGRQPSVNGGYWSPWLQGNVDRDRRQTEALQKADWRVLRHWEHEPIDGIVASIGAALKTDAVQLHVGYRSPASQ